MPESLQAGAGAVTIRPMSEGDLPAADAVMRLAFGTFIGLPDPSSFLGDASYVPHRWRAAPDAAYVADTGGRIVGSNLAAQWGSFGFLGPLTIHPEMWDRGLGRRLLEPIVNLFAQWGVRMAGLFTFPESAKHVGLYQRYGFHARYLTAIMSKPVGAGVPAGLPGQPRGRWTLASASDGEGYLRDCRKIADSLFEGLDLAPELRAIRDFGLGDTVLLWDDDAPVAFAACHVGAGTEAGSGTCYIKFAAVRSDKRAAPRFEALLAACDAFAASRGASRLVTGVNSARREAYAAALGHGYRPEHFGIAMHRPDEAGFSRPGAYVLDDWR